MDATITPTRPSTETATTVADAIRSRRSVRAYLDKEVSREILDEIFALAARSPSGSNHQPWKVYALTGATLKRVGDAIKGAYLDGETGHTRDYKYYTDPLTEPYQARRRAAGWGMYGLLGISRADKDKMKAQRSTNYNFFGAPVGLVFVIDKQLETGSYLDYGLFMQTVMLAARSFGLHTCPQASIGEYPDIVRRELGLTEEWLVLAGMALGYADPDALVNGFTPDRAPVEEFLTILD